MFLLKNGYISLGKNLQLFFILKNGKFLFCFDIIFIFSKFLYCCIQELIIIIDNYCQFANKFSILNITSIFQIIFLKFINKHANISRAFIEILYIPF